MNINDFQMHAVIKCRGYFCYQTLQKTGHEIQEGGHLQKTQIWQISSLRLFVFQISLIEFCIFNYLFILEQRAEWCLEIIELQVPLYRKNTVTEHRHHKFLK